MDDKLLLPGELAEKLNVSEFTIWNWIREGRIKVVIEERKIKIRQKDLDKFIESKLGVRK